MKKKTCKHWWIEWYGKYVCITCGATRMASDTGEILEFNKQKNLWEKK